MIKRMDVMSSNQNVKFSLSGGDVPETEKQIDGPLTGEKPAKIHSKNLYRRSEAGEHIRKQEESRELSSCEDNGLDTNEQLHTKTVWRTKSDVIGCCSAGTSLEGEYRARSDLHLSFGTTGEKDAMLSPKDRGNVDPHDSKTEPLKSDRSGRSVESLISLKKAGVPYDVVEGTIIIHEPGEDTYFTPSECSLTSTSLTDEDKGRLSHRPSGSTGEVLSTMAGPESPQGSGRKGAHCGERHLESFISNIFEEIIDKVDQDKNEPGKISDSKITTVANKCSTTPVPTDIFQAMHEECVTAYKMIKNYRIRCAELETRLNDMITMGRRMIPLLNTSQFRNNSAPNQSVRAPVTCSNREMVYQLKGERNSLGLSDVIAASVVVMEESEHRPQPCRPGNCGDTGGTDADSEYEIWCVAVECDDPNCLSHDKCSNRTPPSDREANHNEATSTGLQTTSLKEGNSEVKISVGVQVSLADLSETKCDTKDFGIQVCVSEDKSNKTAPRFRSDVRKKDSSKGNVSNQTSNSKTQSSGTETPKNQIHTSHESKEKPPDLSAGDSKLASISNTNEEENTDKASVESSSRCSSGITKETFFRCGKKEDIMMNQRSNARSILSSHNKSTNIRNKGTTQERSSSNGPILQKVQPLVPMTDSSKGPHSNKLIEEQNRNERKPEWNSSIAIINPAQPNPGSNRNANSKINPAVGRSSSTSRRGGGEKNSGKPNQASKSGPIEGRDAKEDGPPPPPLSPPSSQKSGGKTTKST